MASPIVLPAEDKDLDDAALWAVIDSTAASHSSKSRKTLTIKCSSHPHLQSPPPIPSSSPHHPPRLAKIPRSHCSPSSNRGFRVRSPDGEVLQEPWIDRHQRPHKIARSCAPEISEISPQEMAVVKHVPKTPTTPVYSSPETARCLAKEYETSPSSCRESNEKHFGHSLSGQFPSVSLFKEYQNAAMAILERNDYTMISGNPFIKKSGWRKISFYFNVSYEIKDKTIEFDDNRNVQRAEFVVRAHMQGGRFSDGWGSCERREKRFQKPNHDIPSTAETRAKNKACQDLLGIGEYRPGTSRAHR